MADENDVIFDDVEGGGDGGAFAQDLPQHDESFDDIDYDSLSEEDAEMLSNLNQIEALANMSPEIRDTEEYKNLQAVYDKVKAEQQGTVEEDDDYEEEEDDEEGEEGEDDGLGNNVFGFGSGSDDDGLEFEIDEDMASFISDHYGLNDVTGFFDTVDNWRVQAQDGAKVKSEYDEIMSGLQSLPPEIKAAINAYANNENYFEAFSATGGRLDFDKGFEDQSKETVVKHYFSDQIQKLQKKLDDGDIDDVDYEDRIDMLHNSAERLYNSDKKVFSDRRAEILKEQEEYADNFKSSAVSSVESLKNAYPNFSGKELQKVRQRLVDGNIESLFINKDGTYTKEAATMLALAMYGEDVMQSLLNKAELRGKSEANKEIVRRGNKKPKSSNTQRRQQSEAMDSIAHLQGQFEKDPYVGDGYE